MTPLFLILFFPTIFLMACLVFNFKAKFQNERAKYDAAKKSLEACNEYIVSLEKLRDGLGEYNLALVAMSNEYKKLLVESLAREQDAFAIIQIMKKLCGIEEPAKEIPNKNKAH